jgi:predicted P-loop ATPase
MDEDDFDPDGGRPRNMTVVSYNELKRRADLKKASGVETDKRPKITKNYEALVDAISGRLGVSFSFDEFTRRVSVEGLGSGYDGELSDMALRRLRGQLILACVKQTPGMAALSEVCWRSAEENRKHLVRELLLPLKWDGKPHIGTWLSDFCGAEPSEINSAFGATWLIAAVRRVKQPGCKFDHTLMLKGKTGSGKSSVGRILAMRDELFSDAFPTFDNEQRQQEAFGGVWIMESPDMAAFNRVEMVKVKSVMTRQFDRGRPAYGRCIVSQPRQCVFIGTTELNDPLDFADRRFWHVTCDKIDLDGLRKSVLQLWAEAVVREDLGEPLNIPEHLWPEEQRIAKEAKRMGPFCEEIERILGQGEGAVSAANVRLWLGLTEQEKWLRCSKAVGSSMRDLDFERIRLWIDAHGAKRTEFIWLRAGKGKFYNEVPTLRNKLLW